MRPPLSLLILGLGLASAGCSPLVRGVENLSFESRRWLDERHEMKRNRRLADEAWQTYAASHSGPVAPDYGEGFKDGYADYLFAGGDGQGPPLPPRRYWGVAYQSPEGHQAIDQWYAGFRDGALAAKASGYRDLIVVPSGAPLSLTGPPGLPPTVLNHAPPAAPRPAAPPPASGPETLPTPRPEPVPAPKAAAEPPIPELLLTEPPVPTLEPSVPPPPPAQETPPAEKTGTDAEESSVPDALPPTGPPLAPAPQRHSREEAPPTAAPPGPELAPAPALVLPPRGA